MSKVPEEFPAHQMSYLSRLGREVELGMLGELDFDIDPIENSIEYIRMNCYAAFRYAIHNPWAFDQVDMYDFTNMEARADELAKLIAVRAGENGPYTQINDLRRRGYAVMNNAELNPDITDSEQLGRLIVGCAAVDHYIALQGRN